MHSEHVISIGHDFIKKIDAQEHGSQTDHIFTLINAGTLKMHHRKLIELEPNMITLVPAGMPHSLVEGENLDVWWVSFCTSCLGLDENEPLMQPFRQVRLGSLPVLKLNEDRLPYTTLLLSELQKELTTSRQENLEVIRSFLI